MTNSQRLLGSAIVMLAVLTAVPQRVAGQAVQAKPTSPPAADRATLNLRDFDFLVAKITANYAGWDTKVTAKTRPALDALTAKLRARAATASDDELAAIAREWIGFFKDRHVQFGQFGPQGGAAATDGAAAAISYPSLDWTEQSVRARIAALGDKRDPVEGIWSIGGDRYRVGILRTGTAPGRFAAVVLSTTAGNWQPGQIKAELAYGADGKLATIYRKGDHSEEKTTAQVVASGAAISLEGWGVWSRELPAGADPDAVARAFPSDKMFLKRLSPTTLWLRMPDFNDERYKPLMDLLAVHRDDLAKTPNLLIDLRDNGGGSDFVYEALLPFLYTKPVYTIGVEMRASADNLALRREVADKLRAQSPETATYLDAQNAQMEKRLGSYFPANARPFSVQKFDQVLPFPKRVAVMIDGAGSTGEQFLLDARQSHKVTLFGQRNSAGVLDFANVVGMKLPSGRYNMAWATSRSMRLPDDPVDDGGIAPDIRIPQSEKDPVKFVSDWLDRQRD